MDEWQLMFDSVYETALAAATVEDGLRRIIEVARRHPAIFDEPAYWDRAENHLLNLPLDQIMDWSQKGFGKLTPSNGWDCLIADFGDCPDYFNLYRPGCLPLVSEEKFRRLCLSRTLIGFDELAGCLATPQANPEEALYVNENDEMAYHEIGELDDEILSWNEAESLDFHGNNGYLMWLAAGSLTMLQPLRNDNYCRQTLRGRDRIYLLAGFEGLFFYLATVTTRGLLFERPVQRQ